MLSKIKSYYFNNQLLCNAAFSVGQVIIVGLTYFIIYTLLLQKLGPEKLGIWSLILSTTSVASVATTGLTLSLVKYIAVCRTDTDHVKINNYIKTGLFIIGTLTGVIIIVIYFSSIYFLPLVIPENSLCEALYLLPFSLFSLFLNGIGGVFLSSLEGLHHSTFKSITYILSSIIFIIVAYLLINKYGLFGIAIAQIIQAIALIFFSLLFLNFYFKRLSIFPVLFDKSTFKEIFTYSLSFQFISVSTILVEPLVKFMMSKFGGLAFVGYYEMASRLVSQIRSLIISANQIMVPYISRNFSMEVSKVDNTYPILFKFAYYVSVYLMILLITLTPKISLLWIGSFNDVFVKTLIILSFATLINLASTPAYFSSMGMGKLKGILASHATFLFFNITLGYLFGLRFGGLGVIISYSISYILCSFVTISYYHYIYNFSSYYLLTNNIKKIWFGVSLITYVFLSTTLIYYRNDLTIYLYIPLSFIASFIFIYIIYIKDKSIQMLIFKIKSKFSFPKHILN